MKSSTGRITALTARLREAQMPSGTASTMVITPATSTSDSVFIASSHSWIESMSANPAKPPGEHREDAREQQGLRGAEHAVHGVVHALDDAGDEVEEPAQVVTEPVDAGVDPASEFDP